MIDSPHEFELLDALPRFATAGSSAIRPGFDRILRLLEALDNPHLACPTVHVAGTNGKGSTASFIAAIATASGLRTGLHTSPHLISVTERMRIDGKPASASWLSGALARMEPVFLRVRPSYFEATVALSFARFAEEQTDLMVVEVGLGGRLDATNIVDPSVCVITDIGLDHRDLLGDSVEAIAREKAGIMKHGIPVVAADSGLPVETVLSEVATAVGAPLHLARSELRVGLERDRVTLQTPEHRYDNLLVGLPGLTQARNAALAVRATELLSRTEGLQGLAWPSAVAAGLADVSCLSGLRGRMETLLIAPRVIVDVAHNAEGMAAALETFPPAAPGGRRIVVLGLMSDKPAETILRQVVQADAVIVPVSIRSERAIPARELAGLAESVGATCAAVLDEGPGAVPGWIRRSGRREDSILIAGSHELVGPVLNAWT